MVGHAHRHRIEPRSHYIGHVPALGEHERKRSRHEFIYQFAGVVVYYGDRVYLRFIRHVDYERIGRGAALGFEHLRRSFRVESVRSQPVYGLGGESHDFSAPYHLRASGDILFVSFEYNRIHFYSLPYILSS